MSSYEKYIATLKAEDDAQDRLVSSLSDAAGTNPDEFARMKALSKAAAVRLDAVPQYKAEAEQAKYLGDAGLPAIWKDAPLTADFLSIPDNAKLAHDDVDNLSGIEQALGFLKGTGSALLSAGPKFNEGAWGLARAGAELLPDAIGRPLADKFGEYNRGQRALAASLTPKSDSVLGASWYSGMQSLGLNLLQLPLGIGGKMAPVLTSMGLSTGGQAYGEARDQGLNVPQALSLGASQGLIEAGTEMIGMPALFSLLKPGRFAAKSLEYLVKEQGGEQIATHLQDLNEWAVLPENKDKTFADYLEARPSAALQTALATAFGGGGQVAIMKGVQLIAQRGERQAAQAEQAAEAIDRLNALAAASKVLTRDPETFEQFIAQAAEEGPVQAVFIDAQTLMQSGIAEQLAALSPAVAEQLETAAATGGRIAIPVEEYAARIAPTEYAQGLLDHLSVEPEGFSRAAAREYMQGQAEELQADAERVLAEKEGDDTFKASADVVRANVKAQLDAAGTRFRPEVHDAYASLVSNFFAVTAAKIGTTPEELFRRYPLKVGAQRGTGLQLEQAVWHGTPHVWAPEPGFPHGRPRLDKMGTGEGAQAYGWGWYSAESQGVASSYRDMARHDLISYAGPDRVKNAAGMLASGVDSESVAAGLRALGVKDSDIDSTLRDARALLRDLGSLYQLDIPDDVLPRLLDWDKPLSEQSAAVASAVAVARRQVGAFITQKAASTKGKNTGANLYDRLATYFSMNPGNAVRLIGDVSGMPAGNEVGGQVSASLYLARIGIPGLRYLDGNSRADGTGTYNYVLWDQPTLDRIALLERNGEKLDAMRAAGELFQGADPEFDATERTVGGRAAYDKAKAAGQTKLGYHQWVQVRTPAFKAWFGDWEGDPANASKVVDPDTGEPLVVYHGTTGDFSEFESRERTPTKKLYVDGVLLPKADSWDMGADFSGTPEGIHYGAWTDALTMDVDAAIAFREEEASRYGGGADAQRHLADLRRLQGQQLEWRDERGLTGDGFYFTPDTNYSFIRNIGSAPGGNAMPVFLSIKNPTYLNAAEIESAGMGFNVDRRVVQGYDGAIFAENLDDITKPGWNGSPQIVAFRPEQIKSAIGNRGTFDATDANILNQGAENRGAFNPDTLSITLLKKADWSTFLHETGHFFLEVQTDLAAKLRKDAEIFGADTLKPGERQILADTDAVLRWFGVRDLAEWYGMDFERKRAHHEQFARGFEAYLFEGKAPDIELHGLFQRFRAWLLHVYKDIKRLNVEITDEVRGVFDRMVATNEQIALMEQARSQLPLFASPEQAGMTVEEFAAYQALGTEATATAIDELQARSLRDMKWLQNARGRALKALQQEAKAQRAEVEMDARREVMRQPIYRAWQFLTGKLTVDDKLDRPRAASSPDILDETVDSLFVAIGKLGGINKDEAIGTWGIDPADKPQSGVFGKPLWRREGGLSLDGMAEALAQYGYLDLDANGTWDLRDFEERFKAELAGDPAYSTAYDYDRQQQTRAGDQLANPQALGAGRFDLGELQGMDLPPEVVNALKARRMTAAGGLHPDIVADIIGGFSSGDELVRKLAAVDPPAAEIEALTDTRMLEQFGDLATPEALERAADKAVHNEARLRFVVTEANALARAVSARERTGTARNGRPITRAILPAAAKAFAETIVSRLKVRNIRPGQYAAAEVRAAKAAAKAHEAGDLATAAAEKRNQVLQGYATRAAHDAQAEVARGVRYLKKFQKDVKGLDAGYAEQIHAMLERFDLRQQSNKAVDKRTALATWLTAQREEGYEPDIPEKLAAEAFRTHYKNLTVEEFRGLVEAVRQIEHIGRTKNRLLTDRKKRAYEAVRDEIAGSIEANAQGRQADTRTPTTKAGRWWATVKNFGAAHIKASTWARIMDGGKDGGPVWEYFVRSANERGDQETTMRAEATAKLSEIFAPVLKAGRNGGAGRYFPSIGRSLNREARIALALNTGNAGNLQRLLGGEGWTQAQIDPVLQSLTPQEWAAVQAVWDHFESYRPLIAAKERRVYGKEPEWVEPRPFTVTTAEGGTVELRGGYYPIKFDPAASQRAEEHTDAEGAKRQLQGAYTSATTRRSFTKKRVEEVQGRPLLYTLAGMYSGVNDVIHDLAWHEWLIDANRLLRSHTIDEAIRGHYGPAAKQQFKTWVQAVAEGDQPPASAGEAALGRLRQGVSAAGLGFNAMSAALQLTGFNQSIVRIGARWVGRGIAEYLKRPRGLARTVNGMSSFMANRSRTRFRELNELRNRIQEQSAVTRFAGEYAYFMLMRVQQVVDVPTWWGAYEKAVAAGNDEDRAVALADQAVLDAQAGGQTKDLSAIERGGPAMKLFTVFYGFMNSALNLGVGQTMTASTPAKRAKLAADYLLLYVVPPVLGFALKEALAPGDSGDEWEDIARKLIAEQLGYLMGLMVVVREFGDVARIVAGVPAFGYQGPAGIRLIADAQKFVQQARQGEFDDAFRKAAINLIGDFTGLPAAQANRTVTGAAALVEGKTANPAAILFGFQEPR
jgi:hypothetical protein